MTVSVAVRRTHRCWHQLFPVTSTDDAGCVRLRVMNGPPEVTVALRGAVAALAAALAAGTWAVANGTARYTTYAGRSWPSAALTVAVLAALTVAGLSTADTRRGPVVSWQPLLVALAWIAPVWAGWHGGSPVVRSAAYVLGGWLVAALVDTSLRPVTGGPLPNPERALVALAYSSAAVTAVVLALTRDPYLDAHCLADCDVNVFLVSRHTRTADLVQVLDSWWVALVALAALALLARRLARGSPANRRRRLPMTFGLALFAGAALARAAALQARGVEDPFDDRLFATFVASGCALVLVSAGLVADAARRRRQRQAIAAMVTELSRSPAPGSVQSGLARALGDAELTVGYWLPDPKQWVDADGHQIAQPSATAAHRLTRLEDGGETTAIVRHTAPSPDVVGELRPTVLLGLENERLQAGVLAQLEEIRMSRARIVETGDAERRRLERDLHDGAQQGLLALSYDLRIAQTSASPGSEAASSLNRAIDETMRALADLRELAHGIYPAALPDLGLLAALETLAESAPLPVEVTAAVDRRWPNAFESAAYFAAVEAVADARHRGATYVTLSLPYGYQVLVLDVHDDGPAPDAPPTPLVDRIVACGGQVLSNPHGLRMEIPCA